MPAISATPASVPSPNALPAHPQTFWRNPSVLERSWTPPVLGERTQVLVGLERLGGFYMGKASLSPWKCRGCRFGRTCPGAASLRAA